jgi:dTDP-4-dehydrorhamnose 3,5-epimerase-like enzyme
VGEPRIRPIQEVSGAYLFEMDPSTDLRGWFRDSLRLSRLPPALQDGVSPQQVSVSHSKKHVFRGIHYSVTDPAASYFQTVTCVAGGALDLIVDLRLGSPTFQGEFRAEITPESGVTLLMPPGIGHAFRSLSDDCTLVYTMSRAFPGAQTRVIRPHGLFGGVWNDSPAPIVSPRDEDSPSFQEAREAGLLPEWLPKGS